MTIKNYSKQCLMISAGIMVLALLFWNLPTCYSAATAGLQQIGASVEDAAMALDALAPVSSLSDAAYGSSGNGDSPELGAVLPDEAATDELQRETDRIALAQVIAGLPPLWRQIVLLRYYRDMTQQQVADRLGLSQVKVSREEKKIMAFMRTQLEG